MNVLILCTGNSARSILGEALIGHLSDGAHRGFSAGSAPTGAPNPFAIEVLRAHGIDPGFARSKSWDEFAGPGAPAMDYVFTVCDAAAGESCPVWPGAPRRAHWGLPDPAHAGATDAERRAAFDAAWTVIAHRVRLFLDLPPGASSPEAERPHLAEIGRAVPDGFAFPPFMDAR